MPLVLTLFIVWLSSSAWGQSERLIQFANAKNKLAGTITFPTGSSRHPAVIIVLGSGSQNRDGEVDGHKPFKTVALELARKGFVVLRYDNRSTGRSTGTPIEQSTTPELATDAQAAFRYLSQQRQVDPHRIGLIGHSEGALIATIAVCRLPKTKFLLAINGTTLTGLDDLGWTTEQRLRKRGTSADAIQTYLQNIKLLLGKPIATSLDQKRLAARKLILAEINQLPFKDRAKITATDVESSVSSQLREASSVWQREYLVLNPAPYYRRVSCPITLVFSDQDVEGKLHYKLILFRKLLTRSQKRYAIRVVNGSDHNLISTNTINRRRYKAISMDFVKAIAQEARKRI